LSRFEIDYEDPHNAAPLPNDLFEMLFRTLCEVLAVDSQSISRAYLPQNAQKEFNAGWASIAVFDVNEEISSDFTQAMLIAIHQNNSADAYTLMLTNDLKAQQARIKSIHRKLRLAEYTVDINRPPTPAEL
jgi:hypothetical protein